MKNFALINLAENLASWGMVYITVWWVVIFITLPIGIKTPKKTKKGHAVGAPDNPQIKKKMIITSIIAFFITLIFFVLSYTGTVDFEKLVFGEPFNF